VPVGARLGVHEEAVVDAEPLGERVVVGRDRAAEEEQRRVAVGLREVAEDLVVGAVLLDHVDHVPDGRVGAAGRGLPAPGRRVPPVGARHARGERRERAVVERA
jgi:hypothetical protein